MTSNAKKTSPSDNFAQNCDNFDLVEFFKIYGSNNRAESNDLFINVVNRFAASKNDSKVKKAALNIQGHKYGVS
jgi:hypothetical protein